MSPFGMSTGMDQMGSGSDTGIMLQRNMVTWVYDQPNGGSLEITFSSDGRVVQIHATGLRGQAKTANGVVLGTKMSDVFGRYGYPAHQSIQGRVLNANYMDECHAAFQFYHGKLCGIIVAAVD
jgi:hypothetical protein